MKIYEAFKKGTADLSRQGRITHAWFTSYNLEIGFVEQYLLPVLAGMDTDKSSRPRTVRDYEELQQNIVDIDIRFFADASMIDDRNGKKTPVPIIPVQAAIFGEQFQYGVFHPKVVLLINEHGMAWLMCGSANLTAAAWGQNREAVWCGTIDDETHGDAVLNFYQRIMEKHGQPYPDDLKLVGSEKTGNHWKFISSLNDSETLSHLIAPTDRQLAVFSPYFSDNIARLCQTSTLQQIEKICLIPDVNANNQMRISDENYRNALGNSRIQFRPRKYESEGADHRFTHAKVWVTESRLSIGSWNFTEAGTGGLTTDTGAPSESSRCNIEAGIVLTTDDPQLVAKLLREQPVEGFIPMSPGELEEEKDPESNRIDFFITVRVDWPERVYRISLQNLRAEEAGEYRLELPDQPVELSELQTGSCDKKIIDSQTIVKNHFFAVRRKSDDAIIFRGILYETGQTFRPVWRFNSFQELLYAYMQGDPENDEVHRPSYNDDDESTGPEEAVRGGEISNGTGISETYFTLFTAFENIRRKIASPIIWEEKRRYIDTLPGCISEISEKSKDELRRSDRSDVWKWFLVKEVNALIDLMTDSMPADQPQIVRLLDGLRQPFDLNRPISPDEDAESGSQRWKEWLSYIEGEYSHGK